MSWDVVGKQVRTEGPSTAEPDDVYHAPLHLPAYIPIPGWGNSLYSALLASETSLPAPIELSVTAGDPGNATDPACISPLTGAARIEPGRYSLLSIANNTTAWLCPGVYHFFNGTGANEGLQLGQDAIVAGQGVTLVFENNSALKVDAGSSLLLNCNSAGKPACASPQAAPWRTGDIRHDSPISIWIEPVPGCDPLSPPCSDSTSSAVFDMGSQAGLDIRGIVYGPTDKMTISGNGDHHGSGEIWAWTIVYAGNSQLDQQYEGGGDGYPLLVE
jgi:hypothetical protein